ncbi:DUF3025 domain-containing protein [uncultured Psychrobacter sp.]|uniref:DUF3025 domain-containing protein n=1 Tax=uncultured Psychrobacter sp. TaxID=259303 RepID=UPI002638FCEF|nr:DUF3025 domain-containing protein [uncultured Psychrobacter sp.]
MTTSTSTNHNFASALTERQLEASFANIDWHAPWLYHLSQLDYLSETISSLSRSSDNQAHLDRRIDDNQQTASIAKVLNQALTQQGAADTQSLPRTKPSADNHPHTLQFVPQDALPEGQGYEQFIGTTGKIPTRDNLHDLFNGSIWLTFPKTKAVLNYYHMLEIAKQGISERRGRVRDTITVFDENGAVLVTADPNIGEALIGFDWQSSLVRPRDKWDDPTQPDDSAQAAVYIFGHALLEQLLHPRKPLCAHSIVIHVTQNFFTLPLAERIRFLDDKVAEYMDTLLSKDDVTPRQLAPLPILGVPYFWSDNSEVSFYEDAFVFRSGRHRPKGR